MAGQAVCCSFSKSVVGAIGARRAAGTGPASLDIIVVTDLAERHRHQVHHLLIDNHRRVEASTSIRLALGLPHQDTIYACCSTEPAAGSGVASAGILHKWRANWNRCSQPVVTGSDEPPPSCPPSLAQFARSKRAHARLNLPAKDREAPSTHRAWPTSPLPLSSVVASTSTEHHASDAMTTKG